MPLPRRRLEKRIYIPLPSAAERVELLQLCLKVGLLGLGSPCTLLLLPPPPLAA